MNDFAFMDRANLIGFERHDCGHAAIEREELDFEGLAVSVDMDHGAHIAGFQLFGGDRSFEYDSFVFLNPRGLLFFVWMSRNVPWRCPALHRQATRCEPAAPFQREFPSDHQ